LKLKSELFSFHIAPASTWIVAVRPLLTPQFPPTFVPIAPKIAQNKADQLARSKGYDVYLLPGGSCIPKILKANRYEGIVGVACGEETKMMGQLLNGMNVAGQGIPLIKNGCANTLFNIDTLAKVL